MLGSLCARSCRFRLEMEFAPNPFFLDRFLVKEVAVERAEGQGEAAGSVVTSLSLRECTHISWKGDEHNVTISIKKGGGAGKRSDKKGKVGSVPAAQGQLPERGN